MKPSYKELNLLVASANDIISVLLDIAEKHYPKYYASTSVADAGDWLKWANAECTDEEAQEICNNLTDKNF